MPETLDIVTMRSLVAVAQCGGFHKAARVLHLTQAAVSRHVQRLEDTLKVQLVTREGRAIRFTQDGERFLTHATQILEAHDAALDDFIDRTQTFTIGAMDHAVDILLPALVHQLRAALPRKNIQLRLGRSARLRDAVNRNQLDAALVLERLTSDPTEIGAIPTQWVAGRELATAEDPSRRRVPLVLFDHDCGLRRGAIDTIAAAGLRYDISAESPDLAGIQAAVRTNLGYTLLPALGRLPDSIYAASGLPEPPSVVMRTQTATHVTDADARTIRDVVQDVLALHHA
ncbi:LysR family transcriptional regulator [Naumannella huperziae]